MGTFITGESLLRGREWVRNVGKARVIAALRSASVPWVSRYSYTVWPGGITSTSTGTASHPGAGIRSASTWPEYAAELGQYGRERVVPKGEGVYLTHGLSRWGGSSDAECEAITGFFADADGVGRWHELHTALQEAGLAYVLQESGSSTLESPRFHAELPLAAPLIPEGNIDDWKERYCGEYGYVLGVLSELGGLASEPNGKAGFDPATDRLLQLMAPGARRTAEARVPELVWSNGLALNWEKVLDATEYTAPPRQSRPPRPSKTNKAPWAAASGPTNPSDFALIRAFEIDGRVIRHRAGVTDVRCVQDDQHTLGVGSDTSTGIQHLGREGHYKCFHTHCRPLTREQIYARLSAEAQAVIDEDRAQRRQEGAKRLRKQLEEQVNPVARRMSGVEVNRKVERIISDQQPGQLVVIAAPPGTGKTRTAEDVLVKEGRGVLASPTHELAIQSRKNLERKGGIVQVRQGVLRGTHGDGTPLCAQFAAASKIQKAGGYVTELGCRRCPTKKGCPARKPDGPDDGIIVTVHQLVPALDVDVRDAAYAAKCSDAVEVPALSVVVDECPTLWEDFVLSRAGLEQGIELLDSDSVHKTFNDRYRAGLRLWLGVLVHLLPGTDDLEQAAREFVRSPEGRVAMMAMKPFVHVLTTPQYVGMKGVINHILTMVELAVELSPPEGLVAAEVGSEAPPVVTLKGLALERVELALRLFRPIRELAAKVRESGRKAIKWREQDLVVWLPSKEAEWLSENGAVILDATPPEEELRALRADVVVVKFEVPDGAPIKRYAAYKGGSARKQLVPGKKPNWKRFMPLIREALKKARDAGVQRLLLASYKPVVERWRSGTSPAEELFREWRASGREIDFAYYGPVRGLNRFADFDGSASIGDPWPRKDSSAERADELGIDPYQALASFAARELAQLHGRLRAPTRTTPAFFWHYGQVAPCDWNSTNAVVIDSPTGRPANRGATSAKEVRVLVGLSGGQEAAAKVVGCKPRTIRRYVAGDRVAPDDAVERLKAAVQMRGVGDGVGGQPDRNPLKTIFVEGFGPVPTTTGKDRAGRKRGNGRVAPPSDRPTT